MVAHTYPESPFVEPCMTESTWTWITSWQIMVPKSTLLTMKRRTSRSNRKSSHVSPVVVDSSASTAGSSGFFNFGREYRLLDSFDFGLLFVVDVWFGFAFEVR